MTRGLVVGAAGGRGIARLARSDPIAAVCAAILALAVIAAIFAPIVAPHDPSLVNLSVANEGPSGNYLLGTDGSGRDLLSRIIFGARSSLLGPLAVIVLATLLALTLALSSAWIGGWFDDTVSAGLDMVFAFPGLLLAIGAVAVFGVGLIAPAIALGIAYTPYIARVLRGAALRERRLPYVEALGRAIDRTDHHDVESTWFDALVKSDRASLSSVTSQEGMIVERRRRLVAAPPERVFAEVERQLNTPFAQAERFTPFRFFAASGSG